MAAPRRCLAALWRQSRSLLLPSNLRECHSLAHCPSDPFVLQHSDLCLKPRFIDSSNPSFNGSLRRFSSHNSESSGEDDEDDDEDDDDDDDDDDSGVVSGPSRSVFSGKSEEEKVMEAEEIGYRVIGPLDPTEKPFKPWEPVFAVVQIGSHQFKVCNGDSIFTERLKYCEVNDKLALKKVLMLGSKMQTIIGRPVLPEAVVHAVVEEHALDAKVIIFKKKRRKNYRRTRGHRQELTKLRITDIHGIDKPAAASVPA